YSLPYHVLCSVLRFIQSVCLSEIMDPLQIETKEPLEVASFVHSSNDLDAPKGNSCSTSQILVGSFTLKEEDIADPLLIKNDEHTKLTNFFQSSYSLETPKSRSCNSSQALVGSFTLKEEEIGDNLQIKKDESTKVSDLSHSSYGLDNPKSSSCISSQALIGSFALKEDGSFRNGRSQKKRDGLVNDLSGTGEIYGLTNLSNNSKLHEKIYLKQTVQIEKLSKRTIEENCCGKWRCGACGKIENSLYFLQLHKSTNCEIGVSFICEICRKEMNNYSNFAIHYIEHEADKKKKCPICLCPNVNDIKEHVIVRKHLSEDITGFKFTVNECKRSNEKAKQEVFLNSTVGDYYQDATADALPSVETQNTDISSVSLDVDTATISPGFIQPEVENQEQGDQGKPDLRRKKNNVIYYEFSDSEINDISDEDTTADMLTSVEAQNTDTSSASTALDTVKISPIFSHLILGNQKQKDQGKTDLRISEPYRINDISDEEQIYSFSSSPSTSKKHLMCKVCGDKASGLHYGVATCEACKRFFRRSIQRQTEYTEADCLREGKCLISWVNKSECQFCRFKKCLAAGLSRDCFKVDSLSKMSEKKAKKDHLSILQSTPNVQETTNLRQRKENTVYVESSDFDIDGISDEEPDECNDADYNGKSTVLKKIPTMQSPEDAFVCRICKESFPVRLLLLNHMKAHDRIEIQQCQFYFSKLKKKCPFDRRFDTQHKTRNKFECDKCNKSYPHRKSLLRHKRRHSKGKQNLCYLCGLRLYSPESLNRHMQIHTGEKSFLCDRCGIQFRLRGSLNDHMKMHLRKESRQTPEKLFECQICNKTLATRRSYTSHVKRHTQPKTHGCTFCQKSFYTQSMLIEHMRTHTGEKPLECQTCGKSFAQFAGLYSHMKCHSVERPHRCELCNITFKNRKTRDDHLNTHTGARPYKCKQCDKGFGTNEALRRHKKSHIGKRFREKKYSCSICSEVFADSAYRDLHVALHANPNPFNCEFCSKSFNYKKNMVEHVQRLHPDRNPFK
ncbi:hypothetical protein QYM36_011312, partial [Artemia franciscana]